MAEERGEAPLIVVCDGIEDPHNLGAIIRSAETAGAHGVIIPKRRAVGLTAAVARAAAGALAYVGVHKANNLAAALDELKARGVWLFGAEADGTVGLYPVSYTHLDFGGDHIALVLRHDKVFAPATVDARTARADVFAHVIACLLYTSPDPSVKKMVILFDEEDM